MKGGKTWIGFASKTTEHWLRRLCTLSIGMSATAGASGARKSVPSAPPFALQCWQSEGKRLLTLWLNATGDGRVVLTGADDEDVLERHELAPDEYQFTVEEDFKQGSFLFEYTLNVHVSGNEDVCVGAEAANLERLRDYIAEQAGARAKFEWIDF
jgi:hypothetical protein